MSTPVLVTLIIVGGLVAIFCLGLIGHTFDKRREDRIRLELIKDERRRDQRDLNPTDKEQK